MKKYRYFTHNYLLSENSGCILRIDFDAPYINNVEFIFIRNGHMVKDKWTISSWTTNMVLEKGIEVSEEEVFLLLV